MHVKPISNLAQNVSWGAVSQSLSLARVLVDVVRVTGSASVIRIGCICVSFWASWYEEPTVRWLITDQNSARYRVFYQT